MPEELRPGVGDWLFGCDVCQEVCPYVRRYSLPTCLHAFFPLRPDRAAPYLLDVLALDQPAFSRTYKGTPLLRAKRRGLLRNACVAAANWCSPEALPALEQLTNDAEQLIREHARWAMGQIKARLERGVHAASASGS